MKVIALFAFVASLVVLGGSCLPSAEEKRAAEVAWGKGRAQECKSKCNKLGMTLFGIGFSTSDYECVCVEPWGRHWVDE